MLKTSHSVVKIGSLSHLFSAYTTQSPTELWSLKCSAIQQSCYNIKIKSFDGLNTLWWLCLLGILPKSTTFPHGWIEVRKRIRAKDRGSENEGVGEERSGSSANNFRKKWDKCGEAINNGVAGAVSVFCLIKYYTLKNNSFTPQPDSHLAYSHTFPH